ncbi:hypothetical protein ALC62_10199 [Cyphomyrmex costatus]|uniref:Uncharacterized protein n=1 Tax=Cyphomyrmex costatus TaxID=456900 RepID=A0A195CEF2_9HYME|nr:hypothetical protein ALC62_10199 [Cyphomyrmex costatus]
MGSKFPRISNQPQERIKKKVSTENMRRSKLVAMRHKRSVDKERREDSDEGVKHCKHGATVSPRRRRRRRSFEVQCEACKREDPPSPPPPSKTNSYFKASRMREDRRRGYRDRYRNRRKIRMREKDRERRGRRRLAVIRDPLRFPSPRTSSRSRDREVALTVPHVHSNRTLFLAKKPQVS